MKKKFTIVSGSDKNYLPFLKQLISSLVSSKSLEIVDLCIFSIDLEKKDLIDFNSFISDQKNPNFSVKLNFLPKNNWSKLLTERPYLREYFPGYETYIWMDADIVVLNRNGILDLINGCNEKEISISTENHSDYVHVNNNFGIKNFLGSFYKIKGWSFKNYKKFYSETVAENLLFKPLFNNGVFGMKANSSLWTKWQETYKKALNVCNDDYGLKNDQLSLNVVLYENLTRVAILEAVNNYIYKFSKPFFDKENKRYLTNSYPRREINIVHYTGYKYIDVTNFKN
jgi:lipopolysaccharide biosynthesis glycosyltransferase